MKKFSQKLKKNSGFTLLEVIMTITILLTLTIAATAAMRNAIDIRQALSNQVGVSHGINAVMQRVVNDLEQVFIINTKRQEYNPLNRRTKTLFSIENNGRLSMTTMSHQPIKANSFESDQTFIVYELLDDKDFPGRKNLYRGEAPIIPENFKEDIPMALLAKGVKRFEVTPWSGVRWFEGSWITSRSQQRNKLPRMVKLYIEILELEEGGDFDNQDVEAIPSTSLTTIVYLPKSWGLKEYKSESGSIKWL